MEEWDGDFEHLRSLEEAKSLWKSWKDLGPILKVPDSYCQSPTELDLVKEMSDSHMYAYDSWITKPETTQLPLRDPTVGRCKSYINGEFEKEHKSKTDAVMHLKSVGFENVMIGNISMALSETYETKTAYGRTWERST
jgi:hypothetical protein